MKVVQPHYCNLAKFLLKNESIEEGVSSSTEKRSKNAGRILSQIIAEYIFEEFSKMKKDFASFERSGKDVYKLSIKTSFFQEQEISFSIFEYTGEYDFDNKDSVTDLIQDVLSKDGKYNNDFSYEAIKFILSFYGIDLQSISLVGEFLSIDFKILLKLPTL